MYCYKKLGAQVFYIDKETNLEFLLNSAVLRNGKPFDLQHKYNLQNTSAPIDIQHIEMF